MSKQTCDYCGDPLDENAIQRSDKTYCCEACAFEASRSIQCGGLADPPQPLISREDSDRKSASS